MKMNRMSSVTGCEIIDLAGQVLHEVSGGHWVAVGWCPRGIDCIADFEGSLGDFMQHKPRRTDYQRVEYSVLDAVEEGPPGAIVAERDDVADAAAAVEDDDVHFALDDVEGFTFPEMHVRLDIAVAPERDDHFVDGFLGIPVGTEPYATPALGGEQFLQHLHVLAGKADDGFIRVEDFLARSPHNQHQYGLAAPAVSYNPARTS